MTNETDARSPGLALDGDAEKNISLQTLAARQEVLLSQQEKLLAHLQSSENKAAAKKDFWDRLAAISPVISASIIATGGAYFTLAYNQAQLHLQEVQTIEKFIPHLLGDEKSKRAAILAISSIADDKLAAKVAAIFASPGTVSALESIAASQPQQEAKATRKTLAKALDNMAETYRLDNQYEEAIVAYRKALQLEEQSLGANSPELVPSLDRLSELCILHKDYSAAEDLLKRALDIEKGASGSSSMQFAAQLRRLASLYREQGQESKAQSVLNQAVAIEQKVTGSTPGASVIGSSSPAVEQTNQAAAASESAAANQADDCSEGQGAPAQAGGKDADAPLRSSSDRGQSSSPGQDAGNLQVMPSVKSGSERLGVERAGEPGMKLHTTDRWEDDSSGTKSKGQAETP